MRFILAGELCLGAFKVQAEGRKGATMKREIQLVDQIERIKAELETVKPRSRRRTELEARLRDLTTKLLRSEIRIVRRKAA
jgi:hypothetical protein